MRLRWCRSWLCLWWRRQESVPLSSAEAAFVCALIPRHSTARGPNERGPVSVARHCVCFSLRKTVSELLSNLALPSACLRSSWCRTLALHTSTAHQHCSVNAGVTPSAADRYLACRVSRQIKSLELAHRPTAAPTLGPRANPTREPTFQRQLGPTGQANKPPRPASQPPVALCRLASTLNGAAESDQRQS